MKKSAKLKRKTKRLLIKNLIVFVVLIAVTIVGVRSWFSNAPNRATAQSIQVSCSVPEGLEVAILPAGGTPDDNTVWHDREFTLDASQDEFAFLSTLSIADVTGNGLTFIKPPMMQTSSVAHVKIDGTWKPAQYTTTANKEYLSLEVYFRTTKASQKVQLATDTYYGPPDPNQNYGNAVSGWHVNSVIGAARMAVFEGSNQKLLWIPAPHLYYDGVNLDTNVTDTSNTYGLYYLDSGGNTVYIHQDGTYNHAYYTSDKQRHTISYNATSSSSANTSSASGVTANTNKDYLLHKNVDVTSLTTNNAYGTSITYKTNHVRMNMWIEGEDPESRAAQVSGKFKAVLKFQMVSTS